MCEPYVKYDQTIISEVNGDCMRAAIATMMQWNPSELPNFVEDDNPWQLLYSVGVDRGYALLHQPINEAARLNDSPTGWVMGTVPSRKFPGENHSVVLDAQTLELVHDPNPPEWKRDGVERSEILGVLVAIGFGCNKRDDRPTRSEYDALSAALDAACARIAEYTGCPSVSDEACHFPGHCDDSTTAAGCWRRTFTTKAAEVSEE